jgi:hypothetical protein
MTTTLDDAITFSKNFLTKCHCKKIFFIVPSREKMMRVVSSGLSIIRKWRKGKENREMLA